MRTHYELSNESRKVISDHVKAIAHEYPCNDSYLYQILSGVETDCFAKFLRMYAAAVRAGADVSPWIDTLAAIRTRYQSKRPAKPLIECLTEKINSGAELATGFIEALRDGEIDAREAEHLQPGIDKLRSILDLLEKHIQHRREFKAVEGGRK